MVAAFLQPATNAATEVPLMCPKCGADLSRAEEEAVARGRFMYRRGDGLYIDGVKLRCGWRAHEVIGFIFLAAPYIVSKEVIATKFPYSGDNPIRLIDVYLTQARTAARELGDELPIKTAKGTGVSWADPYVNA
ncbi:MAG: hypothetical protein ABIR08_07470 [Sphingomonas sp.]